ncbi:MAG: enoyl-CoA hydratase/isomerase family protein [Promethearchaeota archaeon]|nr:MAG: enoyl-CoA hydratase/isomerase family protein [Candidatus Lokiarchaeota archaeon]
MTNDLILYETKGKVAILTINRAEKAHAFTVAMLKSLYEKLENADKDKNIKCILIKSTGTRFFSAGYDLKEIQGSPESISLITKWGRKVNYKILTMKKIVITQVQGKAVGFGTLMILASDLRVFADRGEEDLYIHLPELAISAFPQTGATLLPLLAFGLSYAKHLLFTADKADLKELERLNFPDRIFSLEELEEKTLSFVNEIAEYQTEFLFLPKAMLHIMNKSYIKACLDLEDECGAIAYSKSKSMEELDDYIKNLYD